MKRSRFTEEQIIAVLREPEAGGRLPIHGLARASLGTSDCGRRRIKRKAFREANLSTCRPNAISNSASVRSDIPSRHRPGACRRALRRPPQ